MLPLGVKHHFVSDGILKTAVMRAKRKRPILTVSTEGLLAHHDLVSDTIEVEAVADSRKRFRRARGEASDR